VLEAGINLTGAELLEGGVIIMHLNQKIAGNTQQAHQDAIMCQDAIGKQINIPCLIAK
jgi:hypothetical protein